jgi:hypothetical protein
MLAPNDIEPIVNTMVRFYANTMAVDKLVAIGQSLTIHPVKNEVPWISSLQYKLSNLYKNAGEWQRVKTSIILNTLSSFINYRNTFAATAKSLPNVGTGETAARMLDRLLDEISENIEAVRQAREIFDNWISSVTLNIEPLNDSIQEGWRDLRASEDKILTLTRKIVQSQNNLSDLEGVIALDSISSGTVSNVSGIMSNTASMIYSVAIAGYAIPYISVGIMFFTVEKLFYDIFSTSDKINAEIRNLTEHALDLNFEQKAMAQTKSALDILYGVKELIVTQRNPLAEVEEFWKNEKHDVSTIRNNFALDNHFSKENPELLQLAIADSIWFSIGGSAKNVMAKFTQPIDSRAKIRICI